MGRRRPPHRLSTPTSPNRLTELQGELHASRGRRVHSLRDRILRRHALLTTKGGSPLKCAKPPHLYIFPDFDAAETARKAFEGAGMMVGNLTVEECPVSTVGHYHLSGLETLFREN
jgi:hypothetical protein